MEIVEESINKQIIEKYKDELFLFGETEKDLKNKHIIKVLNESNEVVSIAMYSKLDDEELELYIDVHKQNNVKDTICNGIYLDAITSLKRGYNVCKDIINYLMNKSQIIWCYSHCDAVGFWENKMNWFDLGENIFVNQLS
jgi:hypothetical protein